MLSGGCERGTNHLGGSGCYGLLEIAYQLEIMGPEDSDFDRANIQLQVISKCAGFLEQLLTGSQSKSAVSQEFGRNPVDMQIDLIASDEVMAALANLGRTEDVKFSPDNRRLAIAGFTKNKIVIFDIQLDISSARKQVLLNDFVEITSPCLREPHGLCFIDQDTLIVANRAGAVPILKLPPRGMGGQTIAISAQRTIRGNWFHRLDSPGSVWAAAIGHGRHEVLVCNNYANRVTRHVLGGWALFWIMRNEILLSKGLDIPDGVAVNRERKWIAISNHNTRSVLLYENTRQLSRHSEPAGVLRNVNFPHGLCFTPDDNFVLVTEAGGEFVHVFAKTGGGWHGIHDPVTSVRVMDSETFLRGQYNPEEGGAKGIDIDSGMNVLAATAECQPLAFFDLPEVLKSSSPAFADRAQMDRPPAAWNFGLMENRKAVDILTDRQDREEYRSRVYVPGNIDSLTAKNESLVAELTARDRQIALLQQSVAEHDGQITALLRSTSWRVTRIPRVLSALVRSKIDLFIYKSFFVARWIYRILPIRNHRIRLLLRSWGYRHHLSRRLYGPIQASNTPKQIHKVNISDAEHDPLFDYFTSPLDEISNVGDTITRFMHYKWSLSCDLQSMFSLEDDQSRIAFCHWFLNYGRYEFELPLEAFPDALLDKMVSLGGGHAVTAQILIAEKAAFGITGSKARLLVEQEDLLGANLIGNARGPFGMGEQIRAVAHALASVPIPFGVVDVSETGVHGASDTSIDRWIGQSACYGINIFHINADVLPSLYFSLGSDLFSKCYNVGYWAWELSKCPSEFDLAFDMVDEVWAISEFVAESFRQRSPVPVIYMPQPVTLSPLKKSYTRQYFGLPKKRFLFLFTFDSASFIDRKNPIAAVRAFKLAFPSGNEKVHFLFKTMNVPSADPLWDAFVKEAQTDERITIMAEKLDRDDVLGLYEISDAFVSLHRSEGFGRCLAEAMLFGKPVVATNYSGSREIANESSACVVNYTLIPVPENSYPFSTDQVWAEPDLEHAAELMRQLVVDETYRTDKAKAGKQHVLENFNEEKTGARYAERLNTLGDLRARAAVRANEAADF